MMLFNLSLKNFRKSFKDYTIYFLTLILGVAIFYFFNSMDSQEALLTMSESSREIITLLITMLSGVSVCVAAILGFLVVYANNFLIKRRKKEFAIYMTLGMGKKEISQILLGETIFIGILSLVAGLLIGVFASQFISILVAKMFEADMSRYTFIFSQVAMIKTILYFGVMYLIVVIFNAISISRYKLIDLFQAAKKNEKGKMKSSWVSVLIFVIAAGILSYAYYQVTVNYGIISRSQILFVIALGCIGTFLVFWSMSGFLLNLLKKWKGFYLKGLNSFILRQVNNNINTAVFTMTVICLLFFVTISVLSSGLALNNSFRKQLQDMCPRDINLYMDLDSEEMSGKPPMTITEDLEKNDFDFGLLKPGYVEVSTYNDPAITYETMLGDLKEEVEQQFPFVLWNTYETVMGISQYNKMAAFYGQPEYELGEEEYIVLCNFSSMENVRNQVLKESPVLSVGGRNLQAKYTSCQEGFIEMNVNSVNLGIILIPDSLIAEGKAAGRLSGEYNLLAADYAGETEEEKAAIEEQIAEPDGILSKMPELQANTKIALYEGAVGLSAIVTFIAIYLGIIFLIAGAALLALKELSESTDNKERYAILNKIGADDKMQRKALLCQMGIFFGMPMVLAVIHSIFGILFAKNVTAMYSDKDILPSILMTALVLLVIYGGYFAATYFGSRRIIEE